MADRRRHLAGLPVSFGGFSPFGNILEVVAEVRCHYVPNRFEYGQRQLAFDFVAKAARRGDNLRTASHQFFKMRSAISQVAGQFINALSTCGNEFSIVPGLISSNGRPVLRSINARVRDHLRMISQLGTIDSRTNLRLSFSCLRDQPGISRSSQPTQAG